MQSSKFFVGLGRPDLVSSVADAPVLSSRSSSSAARSEEDAFDPAFFARFGATMRGFTKIWHRYELRHAERIPEGPCLFVGNHSGIGVADVLCMLGAWSERFGTSRRVVGMMAQSFVDAPILGRVCRAFGAVYANRRAAMQSLERGHDVVCFPGGDIDACRPFTQPREVVFGDRRGYVKLAIAQGVPIVPIATIGSGYSYLQIPGGYVAARLIRARRWLRADRVPLPLGVGLAFLVDALAIAGVLPWWSVILAAVAAILPNPVRITSEVLKPIDVCALTRHIEDEDERVEVAHAIVHGTLQAHVAKMSHDRA